MEVQKRGKTRLMQCVICVTLVAIVWIAFFIAYEDISIKNDIKHIVEDDFSFVFQVDSVVESEGEILLDGWVYKLNVNSNEEDINILLLDREKEKILYPKIEHKIRDDVNQYFLCEFDYSQSGFVAHFDSKKIDLENRTYEVLVEDKVNEVIYKTGTFISEGNLMYADPNVFCALDAMGTELEEVVRDGVLRVYRPDVGVYVYQKDWKLYWIADETVSFEKDEETRFILHLQTTQYKQLPENRIKYKGDNWDFVFERKEAQMNTGKYRVAIFDMPTGYAVTDILIGYHVGEYVWKQSFRPSFELFGTEH